MSDISPVHEHVGTTDTSDGWLAQSVRPRLDLGSTGHADTTRRLATDPTIRSQHFFASSHESGNAATSSESQPQAVIDEEKSKGPTILCNAIQVLITQQGICSQTTTVVVIGSGDDSNGEDPPARPEDDAI